MLQDIAIHVKSVRYLPQKFFKEEKERELALDRKQQQQHSGRRSDHRRCLRAQASLGGVARETGGSAWGRGMRSREATWLRGADTLSWRLAEKQFKQIKAYAPVCKVCLSFDR